FSLSSKNKKNYFIEKIKWHFRVGELSIFHKFHLRFLQRNLPALNLINVELANSKAIKVYIPKTFQGQLHLFISNQVYPGLDRDSELGWSNVVTNGIYLYKFSVFHADMMREPNVRLLAEKFQVCLEKSQRDATLSID
ncbi:hypothetical protein C7B79_11455, partial [Chroococcidiopsis cubana CCALA 043]